jgi:hypothetical protein
MLTQNKIHREAVRHKWLILFKRWQTLNKKINE